MKKLLKSAIAAITLLLLGVTVREASAWHRARLLNARLSESLKPSEVTDALEEYQDLRNASFFLPGLEALRRPLLHVLMSASRAITEATDLQQETIPEEEWARTEEWLTVAASLDTTNLEVQSRQWFCRGNKHRKAAERILATGDVTQARSPYDESLRALNEAARLDPKWPKPYVSLSWLYELPPDSLNWCSDLDRQDSLQKAAAHGHLLSPSEMDRLHMFRLNRARKLHQEANKLYDRGVSLQRLLDAETVLVELQSDSTVSEHNLALCSQELAAVRQDLYKFGVGSSESLDGDDQP